MINIKKVKELRKAEKNVIWLVEHDKIYKLNY